MDKRAALKAAAAVAIILVLCVLAKFVLEGRIWAEVVSAVIALSLVGYGFYWAFKD